jgi:hypothetical protein
LDVVAHAIDEEVRRRVVAAQRRLVAMALALAGGGAGHEAQRIGDRQDRLIIEPVAGEHGDRLRHIEQRRVGARRCAGAGDGIALVAGRGDGDEAVVLRGLRRDRQREESRRQQHRNTHSQYLGMIINSGLIARRSQKVKRRAERRGGNCD